jgi:hypothetical protein
VKHSLIIASKILLLMFLIIHFFNLELSPIMPGIDSSWQYMANYAFQKHVPFIYGVGPYAFINYPLNIGANLGIAIVFRLALWLFVSGLFSYLVLTGYFSWRNVGVFAALFALVSSLTLYYFLCFVLLLLLALTFFSQRWRLYYSLALCLSALLFLIKFSTTLLALPAYGIFICIMAFLNRTKAWQAFLMTVLGIPILCSALYLLYNPSWSEMMTYLRGAYEIGSEYSVAVSTPGRRLALWLVLVVMLAYLGLMLLLYRNRERSFFLTLVCLPALFFAFKHGFVRQNGQVMYFFSMGILSMGLILLFTHLHKRTMWGVVLLIPLVLAHSFGPWHHAHLSDLLGVNKLAAMAELLDYAQLKNELNALSTEQLQPYKLPQDWLRIIGDHPVSIGTWEAAYAPANNLNYKLFPVLQMYVAYTPYLDQLNADYLENPGSAPEFILMEWFSLDARHALIDVPALWLAMYKWYDVVRSTNNPFPLYLLKRRAAARFHTLKPIESRTATTEDFIAIPVSEHPVVMKLSMHLNLWGTLTKSFFRLPKVMIELIGSAGYLSYRLAPATLQDGMLMNFLPISLQDMEFLMNANQARGTMYGIKLSDQGLRFYNKSHCTRQKI